MVKSRAISAAFAVALFTWIAPVRATDSHDYGRNEYAVIHDGLAPNGRFALAAHGDGEGGANNFHVWLMAEPAHRRIAALPGIGSGNNLDTGPDAYHAVWSGNSRHVAVSWRSGRHVLDLNIYAVGNRGARLVSGPGLFRDVTSRNVSERDDMRLSISGIAWTGPKRFTLKERRSFMRSDPDPGFTQMLGFYGRKMERTADGRLIVEFSAKADCVLMTGNRYRIVDNIPWKFGDGGSW
jgi:hypothetical protein